MAAINHTARVVPCTIEVTLDGTVQQVQPPPNTRYVSVRFTTIATTAGYKLQNHAAADASDIFDIPINEWYGWPLMGDGSTGQHNADGTRSPLYLEGDANDVVEIEYSFVGGRGG